METKLASFSFDQKRTFFCEGLPPQTPDLPVSSRSLLRLARLFSEDFLQIFLKIFGNFFLKIFLKIFAKRVYSWLFSS